MKYFIHILALSLISIASISGQSCSSPRLRKEIRQLTQDELSRYFNAIKKVHATRSNDGLLSKYEAFSKTHYTNSSYAHGTPRFLPWHRYFLRLYELELQKIEPTVVLPYWDWSKDYKSPASSPILSNAMMGSNGDSTRNYCVTNGQIANMQLNYPSSHCLQRSYYNGNTIPEFTDPNTLNSYINYAKFSDFCSNLEDAHGRPHVFIGGNYDFRRMWSPNDPLFYLHHAFIDSLWYEWQKRHPTSNPYDGDAYGQNVSKDDSLVTWPADVKSTFSTTSSFYCYNYPRYSSSASMQSLAATQSPTMDQNTFVLTQQPIIDQAADSPVLTLNKNQSNSKGNGKSNGNANGNNKGNGNGNANGKVSIGSIDPNVIRSILKAIENLDTDEAIKVLRKELQQIGININKIVPKGKIAKPLPLPDDWLEMNRLDKTKVRGREKKTEQFIDLINILTETLD